MSEAGYQGVGGGGSGRGGESGEGGSEGYWGGQGSERRRRVSGKGGSGRILGGWGGDHRKRWESESGGGVAGRYEGGWGGRRNQSDSAFTLIPCKPFPDSLLLMGARLCRPARAARTADSAIGETRLPPLSPRCVCHIHAMPPQSAVSSPHKPQLRPP